MLRAVGNWLSGSALWTGVKIPRLRATHSARNDTGEGVGHFAWDDKVAHTTNSDGNERKNLRWKLIAAGMLVGGIGFFLPGLCVEAAESEIVVTLQTEVQLSLETEENGDKVFCGSGDIYMTTEDAYSHKFVAVEIPDSFSMTPSGAKSAPAGTEVSYSGSMNARRGFVNYQAKNGLDGKTADDIYMGKIEVSIPFTQDFRDYGAGNYSVSVPVELMAETAYGSYSSNLYFTPWDELISEGSVTVSEGKLSKITKQDDILEIDPSITTLVSSLFSGSTYTEVVLPPSVTTTGRACQNSSVEKVIFEEGYMTIPKEVCYNATNLRTVIMPDEVEVIDEAAFSNCSALAEISFPGALTTLGRSAFEKCVLLEEFEMKQNLTSPAAYVTFYPFYGCHLKRIVVDEGVTTINNNIFQGGCSYLEELLLPKSLKKIGNYAFENAVNLKELTIRSNIDGAAYSPFEGSGIERLTFTSDVTAIPRNMFCNGCRNMVELNIPKSVTSIGNYAFENAVSLKSWTMQGNITGAVSYSPFFGSGLEEIHFGEDVTSIPKNFFANGCTSLKELDIPSRITFVGAEAFEGATSLQRVTIHSNLNDMGGNYGPFFNADIKEIVIDEGITKIPRYFFADGIGTMTGLTIPDSVVTIGAGAFHNCRSLTGLDLPASVKSIGADAFYNAESLLTVTVRSDIDDMSGVSGAFTNAGIQSVNICEGVTKVGKYLFANGVANMTSLELPDTLKTIRSYAFRGCSSLEEVDFPSALTTIDTDAFYNCAALRELNIPATLTYIGSNAFGNSTAMEKITIASNLKTTTYMSPFSKSSVKEVVFTDEVTSITGYLFDDSCASMTRLVIPGSVKTIGSAAFNSAVSLKVLTIHSDLDCAPMVTTFQDSGLETIYFDDGVSFVDSYLFYKGCGSLTDVYLPESVSNIGEYAFDETTDVTVHYGGTESQWSAVDLNEWVPGSVICADTVLMGSLMMTTEMPDDVDEVLLEGVADGETEDSGVVGDGGCPEVPDGGGEDSSSFAALTSLGMTEDSGMGDFLGMTETDDTLTLLEMTEESEMTGGDGEEANMDVGRDQ